MNQLILQKKIPESDLKAVGMMRRFGTPFPGHAHRHVADRVLGQVNAAQPLSRTKPDDDIDVIEPV